MTPEGIRRAVETYVGAIASGTADEIAACYAEDGTVEDPVGSEPHRGREAIRAFYAPLEGLARESELLEVRVAGAEAAFHFRVRTILPDGPVDVAPIDVMTFGADGLVTSMRAFWSDEDVRLPG